jgi:hypothetical protein
MIVPIISFGQATKLITDKETNERYCVLRYHRTTKHGMYKKFSFISEYKIKGHKENQLLVKGYYKQGVKDSIWECFDYDGQLTLKFNYTKNDLIFYKPSTLANCWKYRILTDDNSLDTTLSRPPIFMGGDNFMFDEFIRNIRYPSNGLPKSGIVYVIFTVDKFGKTSNYHLGTHYGYGMDEKVLKIVKDLPFSWLPGLKNGQAVDVEVVIPFTFMINI